MAVRGPSIPDLTCPVWLTRRQAEVLELVADGLTDADIAVKLGVEVSTVRTHRAKCYAKLNAHNGAQAVVAAIRRGLIEVPGVTSTRVPDTCTGDGNQ